MKKLFVPRQLRFNSIGLCKLFLFGLITIVFAHAAFGDSQIVAPCNGFSADDTLTAYVPQAWSLFDENMAIYQKLLSTPALDGLLIVDPVTGTSLDNLGKPSEYIDTYLQLDIDVYPAFITPDPDGQSLWVGFTIDYNSDDRIYQVDLEGNWTHKATLMGNADLEFHDGNAYVSANPAASVWGTQTKIYSLDTTGNNQHIVIADVGGYSAGLGIDQAGNIYYGTNNYGTANNMYRFSADNVARANLTLSDAERLFETSSGCNDTDVDIDGHVVFNTNVYREGGQVMIWVEDGGEDGGDALVQIAESNADNLWLTTLDIRGDALAPSGATFATAGNVDNDPVFGLAEISADRIPGDANRDGRVDDIDATIMAANWGAIGACWERGDFDDSGTVDQADADILAEYWLHSTLGYLTQTSNALASVPEPGVLVLLLLGSACFVLQYKLTR